LGSELVPAGHGPISTAEFVPARLVPAGHGPISTAGLVPARLIPGGHGRAGAVRAGAAEAVGDLGVEGAEYCRIIGRNRVENIPSGDLRINERSPWQSQIRGLVLGA